MNRKCFHTDTLTLKFVKMPDFSLGVLAFLYYTVGQSVYNMAHVRYKVYITFNFSRTALLCGQIVFERNLDSFTLGISNHLLLWM